MTPTVLHTGPLGVNTLIVPLTDDKVFIVDPAACSFSGDEECITRYLAEHALTPVAIVLTHGHFDHVSGLPSLRNAFPSIPILIHQADAAHIGANSSEAQGQDLVQLGAKRFLSFVSNLPEATGFLKADATLLGCLGEESVDSDKLRNALAQWYVIHTPGHTKGSCCLYNKAERLLLSGDTVFYMSWGRTDLAGGSEKEIRESLRLLTYTCVPATRVYPGHDECGFLVGDML